MNFSVDPDSDAAHAERARNAADRAERVIMKLLIYLRNI